jgi:LPXTG-motif cell wall-anchored protein
MKGKGKRLAALLTLLVLSFSSVLVVNADSSTKLIKRNTTISSNETYQHVEVSVAADTTDRAGFDLTVKRPNDSFSLYNLVTITPHSNADNGITTIDVAWAPSIATFISNNETFANDPDYASPVALGAYTVDQTLPQAQREAAEAAAKTAKEKKVIALVNAMKAEYAAATTKSSTALGQLSPVATVDGATVAAKVESGVALNTVGGDVNVEAVGAVGTDSWNNTYRISGVPFGLYFVDATNPARASGGGYQPVVVDLVPEQTGPSGHWYIDTDKTATLKNESISLDKKINGGESDILRDGEIVNFQVEFDIPLYTKTNDTFDFTDLSAFDDMSQGYTLIATSATLTYFDVNSKEYHPVASLTGDSYGNKTASDANGTYIATLIGYSYPVTYSGDTEKKEYFYITKDSSAQISVWVNNGGKLSSIQMSKTETNGTYTFTPNDLNNINNQLDTDNRIPTSYITTTNAAKFVVSSTPKSLISIDFDYNKLMAESTYEQKLQGNASYPQEEGFTVPSKVVIKYDALFNDSAYLGNDENTNKVTVYYIEDTTGTVGQISDEVVGWTYGANIVKVDGTAYEAYEKLSDEEKQAKITAGETPYLEGAVFDIYRLDSIYCGGAAYANQNETPAEAAYPNFKFYDDVTYPADPDQSDLTKRYTTSRTYYTGLLQKVFKYELTQKMGLTDPTVIAPAVGQGITAVGDYSTADKFTNKYNFEAAYTDGTLKNLHDNLGGNALTDYMLPNIKSQGGTVYDKAADFESGFVVYVPKWVPAGECPVHSGAHWHLEAYSLFWADTTSVADENGVLLTGFDPNQYLMIEKTAPAGGYNKLNTAIYFEVNQYSNEEYTNNGNSYSGFMSDTYENAAGEQVTDNNEDGIYHFTIKNYAGLTLPSTGGMGTLLFTLIGVIVMAGAIVFIIARRKKLRNAAAFMAIMLMFAASFLAPAMTANAATTISLGNGEGLSTGIQKAEQFGTATFTVHLRDVNDELTAYQIGSVTYNDEKGTWTDLEWVTNLYTYLGNYTLDTGNEDIPTTPLQFTQLPAKEQADFLNWVYDSKDKSGVGGTNKVPGNQFSKVTNSQTGETYMTISGVQYGMYLIKGTNSTLGRDYSVLTLSAAPEIQGPMGVYYLTGDLEATLKYADVTVDKHINGADYDVVRTGETVKFEIAGEVPTYYPITNGLVLTKDKGEEYTGYDWDANYKFSITDEMSSAFKLVPDSFTLNLKTTALDAGDDWTAVDPSYYTLLIDSAYDSEVGSGVIWFKDSTDKNGNFIIKQAKKANSGNSWAITWYVYNEEEGSIVQIGTSTASSGAQVTAAPDAAMISAYQQVAGLETVGTVARTTAKDLFAITFNYSKFIELDENNNWVPKYKYVGITYNAVVTEDCKPGTHDNTNTVNLWYRSDIAGHYTPVTDIVNAYTYGLKLTKTDGASGETPKYLLGAQFKLYKEAYVYEPDNTLLPEGTSAETTFGSEPTADTWKYYSFKEYADNGEYQTAGLPAVPTDLDDTALPTLDLVEGANFGEGLNTYFRYVPVPATGEAGSFDTYKVIVYKQMALEDQYGVDSTGAEYKTIDSNIIYSVDTADGVQIDGLEDGSYVLIETVAPTGYNELTEAMRFEINRLTVEQHEMTENAAYDSDIIFYSANAVDPTQEGIVDAVAVEEKDDQGQTVINYYQGYSDGVYGINVKNYQGLTLPSTGGMGTLLFTIIGVVVMALVIVFILARRKKEAYM